jgi:hypothetical protein
MAHFAPFPLPLPVPRLDIYIYIYIFVGPLFSNVVNQEQDNTIVKD